MNVHPFVQSVAALRFPNCFNPYVDRCEVHDQVDAPALRASALSLMIEAAAAQSVDAIWIGRDLGYRGGRRTGLALTDDLHVRRHAERWAISAQRATVGTPVAERTAAVIWDILDAIQSKVFLWNVFPLHPHEADDPFSNRQHNANERRAGEEILSMLIELLQPARVVAIGNDAAAVALRVCGGRPAIGVRHPSYGGQRDFLRQIGDLYAVHPSQKALF
nr:uracil-DNA glycosylase [Luteibacter rhizovicinus]